VAPGDEAVHATITGMRSAWGETVPLVKAVTPAQAAGQVGSVG
jgi:hypothetical protein